MQPRPPPHPQKNRRETYHAVAHPQQLPQKLHLTALSSSSRSPSDSSSCSVCFFHIFCIFDDPSLHPGILMLRLKVYYFLKTILIIAYIRVPRSTWGIILICQNVMVTKSCSAPVTPCLYPPGLTGNDLNDCLFRGILMPALCLGIP